MQERAIFQVYQSVPTIEGAGVHLKRAFGFHQVSLFDPFLMLDDFHTANPAEYLAGFPWHPHRGIETITYMLEGLVEHGDSMGNRGVIGAGACFAHPVAAGHTAIAYVLSGQARFVDSMGAREGRDGLFGPETVVLYDRDGDGITVTTAEHPVRFLFLAGRPLGESVAWRGPIVMNTQAELRLAFEEYENGTFIK